MPEKRRFARENDPDDNIARLRDRHKESKRIIHSHLKESDFFESDKNEQ